ncbi:ATP-dependent helicase [Bacillus altitudinis]|uniref:ATP-dependent helicase n=1 Tax=Bacillus altitudinis TaxID=293387 RepID=UPI001B83C62E|nr:ATP-dependent helicase [Bacillus altitudinis]MBR0580837.1 ATP-dependent helicase [Bacillus altitudinis A23-8]
MSKILDILNWEQEQAVKSTCKYLKINAGPGTGKTTTLAAKILYVQSELGIDINKILGVSFSRSAKKQLLSKLDDFSDILGYGGKPNVLTFHGLAHRIIKYGIEEKESKFRFGFERINTESFIDLDANLIDGLCTEYQNREAVNKALAIVYTQVRQGDGVTGTIFEHYNKIDSNQKFSHTSYTDGRICISGKDLKTFWFRVDKLEKFRNTTDFQGMITEAIRLLKLNRRTFEKISSKYDYIFVDEYQDSSMAQEMLLFSVLNDKHHVAVVGDKNQTIYTFNGSNNGNMDRFSDYFLSKDKEKFSEIKLVKNYRSTNEVIGLANDFMKEDNLFPYETKSSYKPSVVETQSIKLAATYIADTIRTLIQTKTYKPSEICILYRKNSNYSQQCKVVCRELEANGIGYSKITSSSAKGTNLFEYIYELESEYSDDPLEEVLPKLLEKETNNAFIDFIKDSMNQGASDIDELIDFAVELEEDQPQEQAEGEKVTVQTVHASKGLEYPVVFILYLGDRNFPHGSNPDIAEERRLFYVGITRAKERLFILGRKGVHHESFLDECIDSDNVEHETYYSRIQEEFGEGFIEEERNKIDQTTREQEQAEEAAKEEFKKLMELF